MLLRALSARRATLRFAVLIVFLFLALAAEVRTWSGRMRAPAIDVHRILCAVLAPMPFVGFAAFNII